MIFSYMHMTYFDHIHLSKLPSLVAPSTPSVPFLFPNTPPSTFIVFKKNVDSACDRKYVSCLSESGLFHLTQWTLSGSSHFPADDMISLFFVDEYSIEYQYCTFFIHRFTLDWLHWLALMNGDAINISMQVNKHQYTGNCIVCWPWLLWV
jgi:hypothetical protein